MKGHTQLGIMIPNQVQLKLRVIAAVRRVSMASIARTLVIDGVSKLKLSPEAKAFVKTLDR